LAGFGWKIEVTPNILPGAILLHLWVHPTFAEQR
jgi:hypothetical protein